MTRKEWVDPSSREQVTIMVITTAVEFACGFGILALLILGLIDVLDGSISMRTFVTYPLCLALTIWTGYRAMHLVVHPTRKGMAVVLLSGLVAILPLVALEF